MAWGSPGSSDGSHLPRAELARPAGARPLGQAWSSRQSQVGPGPRLSLLTPGSGEDRMGSWEEGPGLRRVGVLPWAAGRGEGLGLGEGLRSGEVQDTAVEAPAPGPAPRRPGPPGTPGLPFPAGRRGSQAGLSAGPGVLESSSEVRPVSTRNRALPRASDSLEDRAAPLSLPGARGCWPGWASPQRGPGGHVASAPAGSTRCHHRHRHRRPLSPSLPPPGRRKHERFSQSKVAFHFLKLNAEAGGGLPHGPVPAPVRVGTGQVLDWHCPPNQGIKA